MNVVRDEVFGCELAQGRADREGYVFWGRTRAHLATWRANNGAIAEGMEVDHLCRRRNCCALHHLELVTRAENEKRKSWRYRARRSTCPRGHSMEFALVTPEGGRLCRACHKEH